GEIDTLGGENIMTFVHEFILLGFPCSREIQVILFMFFCIVYLLTLMGNGAIICNGAIVCALCCDRRLHIPMYMFLGNFSFLEIWYVSSTTPKMLINFLSDKKTISFVGCFLQFYFFFSLGTSECLHLAVMVFDWYLTICHPLHYPNLMTGHLCTKLVMICWACGFLWFLIPIVLISQMSLCGSNIIDHVVCDLRPLFALVCVSAPATQLLCYTLSSLFIIGNSLFIFGSYTLVLTAVLWMPSATGRHKASSTFGSHLAVVPLFYGSLMVMYKVATLFYAMVTPLFNPFIYSFRNKEIKAALRKVLGSFSTF
uniref:G-protein coupled receptors family 1 profile domain-containing protein n=1 Tax=Sus scrofa TaxID=9823 RepID=A0A8D1U3B6_PIG